MRKNQFTARDALKSVFRQLMDELLVTKEAQIKARLRIESDYDYLSGKKDALERAVNIVMQRAGLVDNDTELYQWMEERWQTYLTRFDDIDNGEG